MDRWRGDKEIDVASNGTVFSCAVGVAALACLVALHAHAGQHAEFAGDWVYSNSCHFGHFVNMEITQQGAKIAGSWADGSRVRGWNGELQGDVRDGRASLRLCTQDDAKPDYACPNFGQEAGYLQRSGQTLLWYRSSYMAEPYAVLVPAGSEADRDHGEVDCPDEG